MAPQLPTPPRVELSSFTLSRGTLASVPADLGRTPKSLSLNQLSRDKLCDLAFEAMCLKLSKVQRGNSRSE